jgi:hypothetical protein
MPVDRTEHGFERAIEHQRHTEGGDAKGRAEGFSRPARDVTVDGDLRCCGCGYNLRTLSTDGRCPECGRLVGESLIPRLILPEAAWAVALSGAAVAAADLMLAGAATRGPACGPSSGAEAVFLAVRAASLIGAVGLAVIAAVRVPPEFDSVRTWSLVSVAVAAVGTLNHFALLLGLYPVSGCRGDAFACATVFLAVASPFAEGLALLFVFQLIADAARHWELSVRIGPMILFSLGAGALGVVLAAGGALIVIVVAGALQAVCLLWTSARLAAALRRR